MAAPEGQRLALVIAVSTFQDPALRRLRAPAGDAAALADLLDDPDVVRAASPHRGPWPRVSIWHGGADRTVSPVNATFVQVMSPSASVEPVTATREPTAFVPHDPPTLVLWSCMCVIAVRTALAASTSAASFRAM